MNTLESRPTRSSASRKAAGFDDQAVEGKDVRLDISIDRSGPVPGTPSATPTLEEGVDGAIYLKTSDETRPKFAPKARARSRT